MAQYTSITDADGVYSLGVYGLYDQAQTLQNFAADDIFDTEAVELKEVMTGADGIMTAGLIYNPIPQTLSLMADSPSVDIFDNWYQAERSPPISVLYAFATVTLPSLGKQYTLTKGVLMRYSPISAAKRVLQPRQFQLMWESIVSSPI